MRLSVSIGCDDSPRLEWTHPHTHIALPSLRRPLLPNPLWHRMFMAHGPLSARTLPCKTHSGSENTLPTLTSLHSASRERLALTDVLDVVEDRDTGVPSEDEVAVHGVDGEVGGDSALGGGETLGYDGAAVDAAGSRGMPEWAGVRVQILPDSLAILLRRHVKGRAPYRSNSTQLGQLKHIFNGRLVWVRWWWLDESCAGGVLFLFLWRLWRAIAGFEHVAHLLFRCLRLLNSAL